MISDNLKKTIANILPYFYLGIMLVVVFILFFFFLYVGIIGAIVGGIIYLIMYLKNKFFGTSKSKIDTFYFRSFDFTSKKKNNSINQHKGRTFDNDEQD